MPTPDAHIQYAMTTSGQTMRTVSTKSEHVGCLIFHYILLSVTTGCIHEGVDFYGSDLLPAPLQNIESALDCREHCQGNSDCLSFVYVALYKECFFKTTDLGIVTVSSRATAGSKYCSEFTSSTCC